MPDIVKGRTCGDCTLCCNVFEIEEEPFTKPANEWCKYCKPGQGCGVYEERPRTCSGFKCMWLMGTGLEEDRPDKLGVVLTVLSFDDGTPYWIRANVDPDKPDAWKEGRANLMLSHLSKKVVILLGVRGRQRFILDGEVTDELG